VVVVSAVEQLIAHWSTQGLPLANPTPISEIEIFESRYALSLPADFRAYFERVNGMIQRGGVDGDREGFAFWPLERVAPLPAVCDRQRVEVPLVDDPGRYFVFADYLQWSWGYAIRLGAGANPVILVGAPGTSSIAQSFTEFVSLYIEDSEGLYPTK
jgi:hypothetical protein